MKINDIGQNQNFKSLNIENIRHRDRKFIRIHLKELKKIGQNYDITLKYDFDYESGKHYIGIKVKDLKEKFNFIKRFFRPSGKSKYYRDDINTTFLGKTDEAIENLHNNTLFRRFYKSF